MADLYASLLPVRLNDGTADANNAVVTNAAPGAGAYALAVRQVGVAAAAALADNTANPTVTSMGVFPHLFDGTNWDRAPGTSASGAFIQGDVAHDAPVAANPLLTGGRASAAAPTDVSADGDAVRAWFLRSGAQATVLTAAGALIGGDATNGLDTDVTRVIPGTGATNLGKAIDTALGATDTGVLALGVRDDALATLTEVDNDVTVTRMNSRGATWVALDNGVTNTVDTELATAAAMSDNFANPTTAPVGAHLSGFDGTTWDRLRTTDALSTAPNVETGILAVGAGPGFDRKRDPANLGTAANSTSVLAVDGADIIEVYIGTSTTGTYTLEVTADDTNWVAAKWVNGQTGAISTGNLTPTTGDVWQVAVSGWRQFRLRTVTTLGATMAHKLTAHAHNNWPVTWRSLTNSRALDMVIVDGSGNQITSFGGGTQYAGDAPATSTPTGTVAMALANATAPADVSANNDAVAAWALRNGSLVVNLASGGTLQAAATLADATANPTVIGFGSFLHGYNGTTWDRVRTANTGRLQVDVITGGGSPPASEVPSSYNMVDVYGSTSGTAAGANADVASNTPANTKLAYIRQISAAASGASKVQLLMGATVKWVGFLTSAVPTGIWRFDPPIPVTGNGTDAIKVNVTNRETSAMDLYARINAIVQA